MPFAGGHSQPIMTTEKDERGSVPTVGRGDGHRGKGGAELDGGWRASGPESDENFPGWWCGGCYGGSLTLSLRNMRQEEKTVLHSSRDLVP